MAKKYALTAEVAKKYIEAIEKIGKDVNLNLKFWKSKCTSSFDAHRFMKFTETNYEQSIGMHSITHSFLYISPK